MLEVLFSDSEKGSMKVAKNYNAKAMLGGSIGYIGKKPTKAELEKHFDAHCHQSHPKYLLYQAKSLY